MIQKLPSDTFTLTYKDLYQILTEAEERVRNTKDYGERARANSQETVDLCLERMRRDGLTREQLERGY